MRNETFTVIGAFLAAGVAFGWLRGRLASMRMLERNRRNIGAWILGIAVALPVGLLMLAKLFGSATLGWMFGLTLIGYLALIPCGLVFGIGALVGAMLRRRKPHATAPSALTIAIDRDCVHASDESNPLTITVAPGSTLIELLKRIHDAGYLPRIHGGQATWVVESGGDGRPVGVCAEQWTEPRLSVRDQPVAQHFADAPARLFFRYRRQADPAVVLSDLLR